MIRVIYKNLQTQWIKDFNDSGKATRFVRKLSKSQKGTVKAWSHHLQDCPFFLSVSILTLKYIYTMKQNKIDYRTGNYAYDPTTKALLRVEDGPKNDINLHVVDRSLYPLPYGWHCTPIILTGELLLHLGFTAYKGGLYQLGEIDIIIWRNKRPQLCINHKKTECFTLNILQNALYDNGYRADKGYKELEIDETKLQIFLKTKI